MARLVKKTVNPIVTLTVVTIHEDDTEETRSFKIGDVVEDLRYVENYEIKIVSGKVTAINLLYSNNTKLDTKNPVDTFSKNVTPTSITIDASDEYESNIVKIDPKEILEDAGVLDVKKVNVYLSLSMELTNIYTDDTVDTDIVAVGDTLSNIKAMTTPGNDDITGEHVVNAFVYAVSANKVSISAIVVTDTENKVKTITIDKILNIEDVV